MSFLNSVQNFDPQSLRRTLVDVRNVDGTVTVTDKYGTVFENNVNKKSEPNFSQYGYIMNPKPDLQIGCIEIDGFRILFGSADVAGDLQCLKSNGVTHIMNLVSSIVANSFPSEFKYLSLVLYDDMQFRLRDSVYKCIDFLRVVKRQKGTCFIHCDAGRCRAPSMVMAYLIKEHGYSYERAYNEVNNARNVAINLNFRTQLMAMA
ncbi:Dual specificity protein phosphatase 19 [Fasciola gigantica]|uniref:Dual specificity protein phosphatase 19 n=1 Tax=Fasciola gigantica TaxID=46835 RepID=A0A504Y6M2_FASGI|nr:Dual specificity protein phosphatase 19 [Fasciola gigantica]